MRIVGCPKHLILDASIHCASDRTLLRSQDTIDSCGSQVCKNPTIRSPRLTQLQDWPEWPRVKPLTTDIGRGYDYITGGFGAAMIGWHGGRANALR